MRCAGTPRLGAVRWSRGSSIRAARPGGWGVRVRDSFLSFFHYSPAPKSLYLFLLPPHHINMVREFYNQKWVFFATAITLGNCIFYRDSEHLTPYRVRRHEWQHILQIRRDGCVHFYLKYLSEYIRLRMKGAGHFMAYLNISYEMDARAHENDGQTPWYS